MRLGSRLFNAWFAPIDPTRLATFERVLSITFLLYMAERFKHAYEWLTARGYHTTHETKAWFQIDPFPLLETWMVPIFGVILFGSTLALIVSWKPRWLVWVVLACAVYVQYVDPPSAYTLNKLYIVCYSVLALTPRTREYYARRGGETVKRHSAWALRTLQLTILVQYFTAGLCKVFHGDWVFKLSGDKISWFPSVDTLWTHIQGCYCTDIAAWMLRVIDKESTWGLALWAMMMYSALLFELCAPLVFGIRKLRPIAYFWGFGFQVVIAITMHQLIYFSLQLVAFYVLFFDVNTIHLLRDKWKPLLSPRRAVGTPDAPAEL